MPSGMFDLTDADEGGGLESQSDEGDDWDDIDFRYKSRPSVEEEVPPEVESANVEQQHLPDLTAKKEDLLELQTQPMEE